MCTPGDATSFHAGSLCFDRLRWRILFWLEPDVVLADAVQASHAALAVLLRSDPRPLPLRSPSFPLPSQPRPASILSSECSPCARLRGGFLMWTDGTRGAGYICSLNSSTFAIVCKWVRAWGGWETMGLGSKCSFPVTCPKVNLHCVIKSLRLTGRTPAGVNSLPLSLQKHRFPAGLALMLSSVLFKKAQVMKRPSGCCPTASQHQGVFFWDSALILFLFQFLITFM